MSGCLAIDRRLSRRKRSSLAGEQWPKRSWCSLLETRWVSWKWQLGLSGFLTLGGSSGDERTLEVLLPEERLPTGWVCEAQLMWCRACWWRGSPIGRVALCRYREARCRRNLQQRWSAWRRMTQKVRTCSLHCIQLTICATTPCGTPDHPGFPTIPGSNAMWIFMCLGRKGR